METFEYIKNKLGFGVIAKIDLNNSKLVIYQAPLGIELKHIIVPLLIKHGRASFYFFLRKIGMISITNCYFLPLPQPETGQR